MKKTLIFLLLLPFSFVYGQGKDKILKVTYIRGNFISPEGDFKVYLYADDKKSQFVYHQKKGVFSKGDFQMSLPFLKYINDYDFLTQEVQDNRVLQDSTLLFSQWKNDLIWEITDEESELEGYKVRKAIATNTLEKYYGKK